MNYLYLSIPFILVSGYFFGTWTCGRKTVTRGLMTTTVIFILLNLFHSIIDGTVLNSLTLNAYSISMVGGHEIIRQPLLYFFYFASTAPFSQPFRYKLLLAAFSVTGVWIVGLLVGSQIMIPKAYISEHVLAMYTYAFFGGDMVHHFFEYIRFRRKFGTK